MFIVFWNWNIAIKLSAQCNFVLEEQRNILQAKMKTSTKNVRLFIRLQKEKKEAWKKLCDTRNISLTNFIIDSVEQKMLSDERRKVLAFIEKQDNLFARIENNINQIARIANSQKFISETDLKAFNQKLEKIAELKTQQNQIFFKIYEMVSDAS